MSSEPAPLWWQHFKAPSYLGAPADEANWRVSSHANTAGYRLVIWLQPRDSGWCCCIEAYGPAELIGAADWLAAEVCSGRIDPGAPPPGHELAQRLALPRDAVTVGIILEDALAAAAAAHASR